MALISSPSRLFDSALGFVAMNTEIIESLVNFPEEIGKQIFEFFISLKKQQLGNSLLFLGSSEGNFIKSLNTFVTAYEDSVLLTVNLSHGLVMINEYFNSIIVLIPFIKELCLCHCLLGNNHELVAYIPNLRHLRKLCLRKNGLKSEVIRKMSIPFRMFDKGSQGLEYLDLSHNPLTDEIVPWIVVFKNLKWVNLSCTYLTSKGIKDFKRKGFSSSECTEDAVHPIFTKGWAEDIIQNWKHAHRRTLRSLPLKRKITLEPEYNRETEKLIFHSVNNLNVLSKE